MNRTEMAQKIEAQEFLKAKLVKKITKLGLEKSRWEKYLISEYGHIHTPLGLNPTEQMYFGRDYTKYSIVVNDLKHYRQKYESECGDDDDLDIISDIVIQSHPMYRN